MEQDKVSTLTISYLALCRKPIEVHKISKIHTDWKGKDKKIYHPDGIIVHIENFEESTKQPSRTKQCCMIRSIHNPFISGIHY